MASRSRAQQLVGKVKETFIRNTIQANVAAFRNDLAEKIESYNRKEVVEDPA